MASQPRKPYNDASETVFASANGPTVETRPGSRVRILLSPPAHKTWTSIKRTLVNPAALRAYDEDFLENAEYVIVKRMLQKSEIQKYANITWVIRCKLEATLTLLS
jgi:hypothetical protein